jgi:hypothetical protein
MGGWTDPAACSPDSNACGQDATHPSALSEQSFALALSPPKPVRASWWIAAVLLISESCTSGRPARQSTGGDQYLIMAAELEATRHHNLYDAVHQLRPTWFNRDRRGGSAPSDRRLVLYINERQVGTATELRSYPISFPLRVRYMTAAEAQVRFGQANNMRPAIVIETERP